MRSFLAKARHVLIFTLSLVGLILGSIAGYQAVGVLGVAVFAPLSALLGLVVGILGLRLVEIVLLLL